MPWLGSFGWLSNARSEDVPWYLAGGVAAANCIAAYKAIGAASLAASYVNLANPGTYDLTEAAAAPTWDIADGWTFNGSTQYLKTGITPADARTWSMVVRFSNAASGSGYMIGYFKLDGTGFMMTPDRATARRFYNGSTVLGVGAVAASGVIAVTNHGYCNGTDDGAITLAASSSKITIGANCRDNDDTIHTYWGGKIQAVAIYNTTLTAAQVEAVRAAMLPFDEGTPEFSLVIIPDAHIDTVLAESDLTARANWIVNNQAALKIACVLDEGDSTNDATDAQFQVVDTFYDTLDASNIPYLVGVGNHDIAGGESRGAMTVFNTYFPQSRYTSKSWWNGGFMEAGQSQNAYLIIGNYLYLTLEFGPRQDVLTWAKAICDANPTKKVFVTTHCYEYSDGSLVTTGDTANPHDTYLSDTHDGQEMWDEFVKLCPNIFWVQSGHINPASLALCSAHHDDTGDGSNKVHNDLCNWQGMSPVLANIRILKFYDGGDLVLAKTYNTTTAAYSEEAYNQFSVTY